MVYRLRAANAPLTVLRPAFTYLATGFLEQLNSLDWITNHRPFKTLNGHDKDLRSVARAALVNKHWNRVATCVLYEAIEVNDRHPARAENIVETLRLWPEVAARVRRLTLFACSGEESESWNLAQLLWLCRNVEDLQFSEIDNAHFEEYFIVLRKCQNLRRLVVSRVTGGPHFYFDGDKFCTVNDFFRVLRECPSLEYVEVCDDSPRYPAVFDSYSPNHRETREARHRLWAVPLYKPLKSMRVLKLPNITLSGGDLDVISTMIPCVEVLEFGRTTHPEDPRFQASMCGALERWRDSLQELSVYYVARTIIDYAPDAQDERICFQKDLAQALSKMRNLFVLELGPWALTSMVVNCLPSSLEDLRLRLLTEDLRSLVDALGNLDYLPKLQFLAAYRVYDEDLDEDEWQALEEICEARGVHLLDGDGYY